MRLSPYSRGVSLTMITHYYPLPITYDVAQKIAHLYVNEHFFKGWGVCKMHTIVVHPSLFTFEKCLGKQSCMEVLSRKPVLCAFIKSKQTTYL